jgi:hypothetical protein
MKWSNREIMSANSEERRTTRLARLKIMLDKRDHFGANDSKQT